jgi:DNA-binding transcriptional ArsR family regulator
MKNDYRGLIRDGTFQRVVDELVKQGMHRPTLRSVYYLLRDRGLITVPQQEGRKNKDKVYKKLDEAMSAARDADEYRYGRLAPEGGTATRGLAPDELDEHIERLRKENVAPVLCRGEFVVLLIEKAGLVDYLRDAVGGRVPVASPSGMVRKEWAYAWLGEMLKLGQRMTGHRQVHIVYLGDCDSGGRAIVKESEAWYPRWEGVTFELYAVKGTQLEALNRERGTQYAELHVDGYISLYGPDRFARELREFLGLPEAEL